MACVDRSYPGAIKTRQKCSVKYFQLKIYPYIDSPCT
jgi:hypothetical protein